jgi:CubicO group peptidase (beta-lactamase class C family)
MRFIENLDVEEYFAGLDSTGQPQTFTRDTLHGLASVTKSVTDILVGIAIDQGLIRGVDEKFSTFFPEYSEGCRLSPQQPTASSV